MASIEYAVEIGAWVESDTPKKNGAGMRKVWVAGSNGPETRLSVIARTDGKADRHLVTLPVGDKDSRDISAQVLALAMRGLEAYGDHVAKPTAPKPAPKAPTPPPADPGTLALFADAKAGEIHPASRRTPPPAPKPATSATVAKARAALAPASAPKLASPAPKPAPASSTYSPADWASLIG